MPERIERREYKYLTDEATALQLRGALRRKFDALKAKLEEALKVLQTIRERWPGTAFCSPTARVAPRCGLTS